MHHCLKTPASSAAIYRSKGFTLVEIMVSVVIGLIAMVVMFQVFANSEAQKRSTTGTGDAQSVANITLVNLQNEIRRAGYGYVPSEGNVSNAIFGCKLSLGAQTLNTLAPTIINDVSVVAAGDANTDTLLIAHGDGGTPQVGTLIMGVLGDRYLVQSTVTFNVGDKVIAAPEKGCNSVATVNLAEVTDATPGTVVKVNTVSAAANFGQLYNLGQNPSIRAYRIRNGNLQSCDYLAGNCANDTDAAWQVAAADIVSLRAQYQIDGGGFSQSLPSSPASIPGKWAKIYGVRVVLVARNNNVQQKPAECAAKPFTAAAPTWGGSADAPINLSDGNPNWQCFRYSTLETAIPLRNIIWM